MKWGGPNNVCNSPIVSSFPRTRPERLSDGAPRPWCARPKLSTPIQYELPSHEAVRLPTLWMASAYFTLDLPKPPIATNLRVSSVTRLNRAALSSHASTRLRVCDTSGDFRNEGYLFYTPIVAGHRRYRGTGSPSLVGSCSKR